MADPEIPKSPWTERFGNTSDVQFSLIKKDQLLHSGLAPIRPQLHPRYYDSFPKPNEFPWPADYEELDEVLVTEEFQRHSLHGLLSWNVPPFNSVLSFPGEDPAVMGGHRLGDDRRYQELFGNYMSQRIEVDESSWLPYFAKDCWYDLQLKDREDVIEKTDGVKMQLDEWSVDNQHIWHHLRFSLEIANRVLTALIRDKNDWLGTLLYGRIQLWDELFGNPMNPEQSEDTPKKRILLSPTEERKVCASYNRPFLGEDIDPDANKWVDLIGSLLAHHTWGFFPVTGRHRARGFTACIVELNGPGSQTLSRINVELLRLLCSSTITIAERCILHGRIAMTVSPRFIHVYLSDELMHAIMMARLLRTRNISPAVRLEVTTLPEPHDTLYEPFDNPTIQSNSATRIPMVVASVQFPSRMGLSGDNAPIDWDHPAMSPSQTMIASLLPAALFWRLQSKAFWDGPVPPNGKAGFRFADLFTVGMQQDHAGRRCLFGPIVVNPDAAGRGQFAGLERRWREQNYIWYTNRPWFPAAVQLWSQTPWAYITLRADVEKFLVAYKNRDEATCAEIAGGFESTIAEFDHKHLPTTFLPPIDSPNGSPPFWLFHSLGLLMFAALPFRDVAQAATLKEYDYNIEPSLTARQKGLRVVSVTDVIGSTPKIDERNWVVSRVSDQGKVAVTSREQWLTHARDIILLVMRDRGSLAPGLYIREITTLFSSLWSELTNPEFEQSAWASSFPFKMPPYSPEDLAIWNSATESIEGLPPRIWR
ncbi:hypothetical protein F5Y19DRAFT_488178 [Xylariaceae sp. FL1651]|nr:hypothetical protein F5Y19DRAFT_488178 [Xylariaceae sp. FL1651]